MNETKERKKYQPIEYTVVGEIENVTEKRTYDNPEKQWKPKDPYYYQIWLKNANPAEYRVISAWKSRLEGDKENPAEKIWEELDKKTFRKYDGKKINFVFVKHQKWSNLIRWQIIS